MKWRGKTKNTGIKLKVPVKKTPLVIKLKGFREKLKDFEKKLKDFDKKLKESCPNLKNPPIPSW